MIAIRLKHIIKNKTYYHFYLWLMENTHLLYYLVLLNNEAFRSFLHANGIQYGISKRTEGAFHITMHSAFSTPVLNMK